jgi:pimeloyl-ACP methyl ester carboxylesterase
VPVLELSDGRSLEYQVSGPEGGRVVLFHHGTPGSAHQMEFSTEAVHRHGWRLVTVSRPGSARSTRLPGRTVADVVPDAVAVLDALGVGRFVVAGASGGGPHALACAALLPDRVDAAQAICSAAPYDADGLDFLAGMGERQRDRVRACARGRGGPATVARRAHAGAADGVSRTDRRGARVDPPGGRPGLPAG